MLDALKSGRNLCDAEIKNKYSFEAILSDIESFIEAKRIRNGQEEEENRIGFRKD
ncbi:MAG: hypothetical protein AABX65_01140 [Nanoarchaeota archaeon]